MRRTIHGCGSSTGSGVRSIRYAWALSNCGRARRTGSSARRSGPAAAAATTPTAATGCRRSSAGSRSSPAGASRRPTVPPPSTGATARPAGRSSACAHRACSASTLVGAGGVPRPASASTVAVAGSARVAEDHERVAPQPARVAPGDVPAPVALEQRLVVGGQQVERRRPTPGRRPASGRRWRRPRWTVGGHASWQSSQPYRRSSTAGRSSTGMAPGRCSTQARQRLASIDARRHDRARSGTRRGSGEHVPQPSATSAGGDRQSTPW